MIRALLCTLAVLLVVAAGAAAQDTTAVVSPALPTSLADFLTTYQLALATLLGSAIVYGLAKVTAFADLGDWAKRIGYLIAALAVTAAVKAVGGTLSPDLDSLVTTGLSGLMSAVTGASVFAMAKTQPGNS